MRNQLHKLLFSLLPIIPCSLLGNNYLEKYPSINQAPQSSVIQYTDSCQGNLIQFSLSNTVSGQYVDWNFDDPSSGINNYGVGNTSTHTFLKNGNYHVTVYISTSSGIDTLIRTIHIESCQSKLKPIEAEKCSIEISNVITPNNDGKNEIFEIKSPCSFETFELSIFNRWGVVVYKSTNQSEFWNGKNQKEDCPDGSYIYLLKYKFKNMDEATKTGNIQLMR
jgi:gliding motility-associated-like protein